MSEFHGGFLVRSVDAAVAEPIRLALAAGLRARRIDPERNYLTFAAIGGCPVMHVAVRGQVADGKDYAFFHQQHSELGAAVARAAGADVWAYHYENQSGSESVRAFAADGTERGTVYCSWDDLDEQLGGGEDDEGGEDDADRHERLLAAAPLGVLAAELGVPRGWLDMDLAYDTPTVRVELTTGPCTDAVAGYLAGPLRAGDIAPPREARTAELGAVQGLYFPAWMAEELEAIAHRLGVTGGTVAWAAWEAGKPELYRTTPIVDDESIAAGSNARSRFLVPPPPEPPARVVVPRLVPVFAKALPEPPKADDKVLLRLALPARVLEEVRDFATSTDRSLSWSVQRAFVLTRGRLHAAQTP